MKDQSIKYWLNETLPATLLKKDTFANLQPFGVTGNYKVTEAKFSEYMFQLDLENLIIVTPNDDINFIKWAFNYLPDVKVKIAESEILGHGINGLFAKKKFKNGDIITEYGGIRSTKKAREIREEQEYTITLIDGTEIFGKYGFQIKEAGRWANGFPWTRDTNPDAEHHNNAKAYEDLYSGVIVHATEDINEGDEIFMDYGPGYDWESIYPDEPQLKHWLERTDFGEQKVEMMDLSETELRLNAFYL